MSEKSRKPGELESAVLNALWDFPEGLTSTQVHAILGDESIAMTTLLTVLSRLVDKELVEKETIGARSLVFRPAQSRERFVAEQLARSLAKVDKPQLVFAHLKNLITPGNYEQIKNSFD